MFYSVNRVICWICNIGIFIDISVHRIEEAEEEVTQERKKGDSTITSKSKYRYVIFTCFADGYPTGYHEKGDGEGHECCWIQVRSWNGAWRKIKSEGEESMQEAVLLAPTGLFVFRIYCFWCT